MQEIKGNLVQSDPLAAFVTKAPGPVEDRLLSRGPDYGTTNGSVGAEWKASHPSRSESIP
jgi:hypothetical protein